MPFIALALFTTASHIINSVICHWTWLLISEISIAHDFWSTKVDMNLRLCVEYQLLANLIDLVGLIASKVEGDTQGSF